jgi:probable rRNA maturation factor
MATAVPHDGARLAVAVVDERGRPAPARGLAAWLRRIAPVRARGSVSIALVSDTRIRALNRKYRRKDTPTDVLSFPTFARPQAARASAGKPAGGKGRTGGKGRRGRNGGKGRKSGSPIQPIQPLPPSSLGEIVIARGVARRQARAARHSEQTELRVLALHGLLHLLGYDHERDNGRMRRVEGRLRRKGGLREGLIARAAE